MKRLGRGSQQKNHQMLAIRHHLMATSIYFASVLYKQNLKRLAMSKDASSLHHSFDINHAVKLGSVDLAIFYHHINHWVQYNARMNQNFYEGKYWTYQTLNEIHNHFPYWTIDQLRNIIKKMVSLGVLVKGNFNKAKFDQTIWYSIDYEKANSIWENYQIEKVEPPKGIGENPKPIPDNKPNNNNNVVVVVARDDALVDSPKKTPLEEKKFTKDDLFAASIRLRKDWTTEEIEEAWNIFTKSKIPISSPFDYVEGIINNKRKVEEAKNKQPKTFKDSKCKTRSNSLQTKNMTKECKQKVEDSNSKTLEKGTLTQPFLNWKSIVDTRK